MNDDESNLCSVCGMPVRYGSRHHQCGDAIRLCGQNAIRQALERINATKTTDGDSTELYKKAVIKSVSDMLHSPWFL